MILIKSEESYIRNILQIEHYKYVAEIETDKRNFINCNRRIKMTQFFAYTVSKIIIVGKDRYGTYQKKLYQE